MYDAIHLNYDAAEPYKVENSDRELSNLAKVNIFIGPNNSGKSRFLRSLFINEDINFKVKDIDLDWINHILYQFLEKTKLGLNIRADSRLSDYGINEEYLRIENPYFNRTTAVKRAYDEVKRLTSINTADYRGIVSIGGYGIRDVVETIKYHSLECLVFLNTAGVGKIDDEDYKRRNIYVPVLRGLRSTNYDRQNNNEKYIFDNYKLRTRLDYFENKSDEKANIHTGLNLYEEVRRLLLGVSTERQKVRDFESFLSHTFFEGQDLSIVPHIDDDVVYVKIGNSEDLPIYNLGEGIQSIIILTYPLFFNQDKRINFFFEEPDMFLHPGYQRIFLEILNDDRFKSFQFFFTTHSNHFLDMTLDYTSTSVYSFHKNSNEEFLIKNIKSPDKDILQALGVRNSSVFLANCTIWVEGITDRIYMRKYLELYMQGQECKYKEDIHYSFIEYGGNNITHWSFLESEDDNHKNINVEALCGTLFLIADSDGAKEGRNGVKPKKLVRQEKLQEVLKDRYYCLNAIEIENLLKHEVIIATIKDFEGVDCASIDFSILEKQKYNDKKLGEYIDKNIQGLKRKYASESGTVNQKVQFAKYAMTHFRSLDDLSEEAKNIAERLYQFIEVNNPR